MGSDRGGNPPSGAHDLLLVLAGAVLLAVLAEGYPRIGIPLLVLVVLVMLSRGFARGYLVVGSSN